MLEQLQFHRQILYDLTLHYLEPKLGLFERLAYLASLRDPETGKYRHDRLETVYGEARVGELLSRCHEEMFERLLETPLALQERDLFMYLGSLPGALEANSSQCRDRFRGWIPLQAPGYLKELFCSNLDALCELLQESKSRAQSSR